jgi:hypothetical protein
MGYDILTSRRENVRAGRIFACDVENREKILPVISFGLSGSASLKLLISSIRWIRTSVRVWTEPIAHCATHKLFSVHASAYKTFQVHCYIPETKFPAPGDQFLSQTRVAELPQLLNGHLDAQDLPVKPCANLRKP